MKKVFIIAEAGVNHNGNLDTAHELVDAAFAAGADAIKFQTFKAEALVGRNAPKAEYQLKAPGASGSQFDMIKKLELDELAHQELIEHCSSAGLEFLSSAFDMQSIMMLKKFGVRLWKIPSGEITNLPYLRYIGSFGAPVLISTGMCTLGDVESAISVLEAAGTGKESMTVLHCTTEYPAPLGEVNLRAMVTMGKAFGLAYGYSDHTQGIAVPIAASALGASVIEKHFTLDRNMEGPDHRASLEPKDFGNMVAAIREVEKALGDGCKRVTRSEAKNAVIARKSIVAAKAIRKGSRIRETDLTAKRPGSGISPMNWDRIVGSIAACDYEEGQEIAW